MTVLQKRKLLNQIQKWRATRTSMDGVGSMLAWVAHFDFWCASVGSVSGMDDVQNWIADQRVQRGQGGVFVLIIIATVIIEMLF